MTLAELRPPLPPQPSDVPWPTVDWPTGPLPPGADGTRIQALLDHAFADPPPEDIAVTEAVVIVQGGRLVAERYAASHGPDATCWSWSMAKSITHALVGMAVKDGLIDIFAPADVPEWRAAGDPRGAITLDQLLRMSSGLAFKEVYESDRPSDVIEMLWGSGKADVAAFAAGFTPAHEPGSFFAYSSGTTNIVCRCLARATGRSGPDFHAWMTSRLFEPLGITSAKPRFDDAGTFIGSSFCFATPRDFARFGLFYLRDGVWDGERLLPEGWVDYARTPTYQQPGAEVSSRYGAHWWLDLGGPGTFWASGHDGQCILVCPDRDLIVVRHGVTPSAGSPALRAWIYGLAAAVAPPLT